MSTENETMDNQPQLVHADSPIDGPGAVLRKAREQLGLLVSDIATQLHLSSSVINALEADEYSKLAAITFARGYLRSYAKYLKLDDDDIIQRFAKLNIVEPERPPIQRVVVKEVKAGDRPVKWISYTIALALGGLVIVWWHNHSNSTQNQATKQVATATLTTQTTEQNDIAQQDSDSLQTIDLQPTTSGASEVAASNQQVNVSSSAPASDVSQQQATATPSQSAQTVSTHTTSTAEAPTTNKVHQSKKKFTGWNNPDLN